jgi:hypothetical protein
MVHSLGIDVRTKDAKKLVAALGRLKSTTSVTLGGVYHEDTSYQQIFIETSLDEKALDDWLYRTKHGCDYVGVFQR